VEKKDLPAGWEWKKLGEICSITGGYAFKSEEYKDAGIPLIRISNVSEPSVSFENDTVFLNPIYERKYSDFLVKKNDILIALSGATTGKFGKYTNNFPALLNQRVGKVSINNNGIVESDYIFFFLKIIKEKILQRAYGGAQPNISPKVIEDFYIPLPPLAIQRRIVEILEQADALRRLRAQADAETHKLLQSVFYEMFGDPVRNEKGWEVELIGHITTKVSSGATPRGGAEVYERSGIEFIRSQNVHMNRLIRDGIAFIPENIHQDMKRSWVKNGDVLFNITGASIGRVAWYQGKDDSANVNQHVCIIRPIKEKILPRFLSYQISFPSYQNKIFINQSGATRQAFNYSQISNFSVILPPISLQRHFEQIVQKEEQMRENQSESNQNIERLFEGLMTKSFTGELN
jgi:type I restriction enzyme S subunit